LNYSRSRRSFWRRNEFRIAAFLLSVSALLAFSFLQAFHRHDSPSSLIVSQWAEANQSANSATAALSSGTASPSDTQRIVYPYSVIPGGVRSPEELREAGARDPVVSQHYSGFDFQRARVIGVQRARLVYLSYRIGDKIYWTTKQVSLHRGEKLITDGTITARTRCGNRISALPQKSASKEEPRAEQFDQPIGSSTKMAFPDNFRSALDGRPMLAGLGPASPLLFLSNIPSSLPGGFLATGSPLVPGLGPRPGPGPGGPGSTNPNPGPPGTGPGPGPPGPGPAPGPPTSVPEPGAAQLISAELLAMVLCWKTISRKVR